MSKEDWIDMVLDLGMFFVAMLLWLAVVVVIAGVITLTVKTVW